MGAIAAGGFAAGIYTTNEPDACKYILKHSKARIVVVDGQKQLDKILKIRGDLKDLTAIVVWGDKVSPNVNDGVGDGQAKVYGWDDFIELGASVSDAEVEARMADQKPGHCSTLIYTSGTTGDPKAVMISHDNVTWVTRANIAHHPDFVSGRQARRAQGDHQGLPHQGQAHRVLRRAPRLGEVRRGASGCG
jgi:long-chain-fatty-acid--CoA ligase ACSBG